MFNAFKYTKQLEDAGSSRAQAETQLQVMMDMVVEDLATKRDLAELRDRLEHKMDALEHRLVVKMATFSFAAVGAVAALVKIFS